MSAEGRGAGRGASGTWGRGALAFSRGSATSMDRVLRPVCSSGCLLFEVVTGLSCSWLRVRLCAGPVGRERAGQGRAGQGRAGQGRAGQRDIAAACAAVLLAANAHVHNVSTYLNCCTLCFHEGQRDVA